MARQVAVNRLPSHINLPRRHHQLLKYRHNRPWDEAHAKKRPRAHRDVAPHRTPSRNLVLHHDRGRHANIHPKRNRLRLKQNSIKPDQHRHTKHKSQHKRTVLTQPKNKRQTKIVEQKAKQKAKIIEQRKANKRKLRHKQHQRQHISSREPPLNYIKASHTNSVSQGKKDARNVARGIKGTANGRPLFKFLLLLKILSPINHGNSTGGYRTMKALIKKKAREGIWLEDVPEPELGINDVLIKIKRTAICGTDMHVYNWNPWAQKTIPVPMVVGHEFVQRQ